jgi:hypothetical protein
MTPMIDLERALDSWMADGPTRAPERVVEAALDRLDGTPQRRVDWRPRRRIDLHRRQLLGLVAAAVVVGALGVATISGRPRTEPDTTPAPTVQTAPTPRQSALPSIAPSQAAPPMVWTFVSERYGYSVGYPAGFVVKPASRSWLVSAQPADDETDQLIRPPSRAGTMEFRAAAIDVPKGTDAKDWIASVFPQRKPVGVACSVGGPSGNLLLQDFWQPTTVASYPAHRRFACGYLEAVVVVDGKAWYFSYYRPGFTLKPTALARATFEAWLATVRLAVDGPIAPQRFVSDIYGYSLLHPARWDARRATIRWVGQAPWSSTKADVLQRPGGGWFKVLATSVPPGTTIDEWIATSVPSRPEFQTNADGHRFCRFRDLDIEGDPSWSWANGTIGGQPARLRAACGFVDGVTIVGGRAYIFSSFTGPSLWGDLGAFHELAATVEFGVATDATFQSQIHGYAVTVAGGTRIFPATAPWTWGTARDDAATDVFMLSKGRMSVASTQIPEGVSDDAWIDETFPPRFGGPLGRCVGKTTGPMGAGTQAWSERTAGNLAWRVRQGCGYMEALLIADDRAWILELKGPHFYLSARPAMRAEFTAFLDSFVPPGKEPGTTYTSQRYGYMISFPGSREIFPAQETWTAGQNGQRGRFVDVFSGPISTVSVFSTPIADSGRLESWLQTTFPSGRSTCSSPDDRWRRMDAGDEVTFERTWCGVHQEATYAAGRVYVTSITVALAAGDGAFPDVPYEIRLGPDAVST